jgi:hypothetical protein
VIWWDNPKHINQISYERRESMFSDHKPVISYFDLMTFETDLELKASVREKIEEDYIENISRQKEEVKESYLDDLMRDIALRE